MKQEEAQAIVKQLSDILDPLSLQEYIFQKSKHGRRRHPSGSWGYTRGFMGTYAPSTDPQRVIEIFERAGVADDLAAGRFLLTWDRLID